MKLKLDILNRCEVKITVRVLYKVERIERGKRVILLLNEKERPMRLRQMR